jgi:PIN domain nuclease of toxin-antitoxin system
MEWFVAAVVVCGCVWAFISMNKIAEELAIETYKRDSARREKIKKLGIPTGHATDTFIWLVEKNAELEKRVEELEKAILTDYYNESE